MVRTPMQAYDRPTRAAIDRRGGAPRPAGACARSRPSPTQAPVEVRSNVTRERYHEMVKRAKEYIEAGDVFQVVPSQRLSDAAAHRPAPDLPLAAGHQPVPVPVLPRAVTSSWCWARRPRSWCGSRGATSTCGRSRARARAATRRRRTCELERELLRDPKELAEHIMLVDLGRNDVGRVAEIGSVHVDELQVIERYSHVMHIVSNVRGRLRPGATRSTCCARRSRPARSPARPRCARWRSSRSSSPSAAACTAAAWATSTTGATWTCASPSARCWIKDGQIHVQAGGGVVADSDPETEYEESLHKARAAARRHRAGREGGR